MEAVSLDDAPIGKSVQLLQRLFEQASAGLTSSPFTSHQIVLPPPRSQGNLDGKFACKESQKTGQIMIFDCERTWGAYLHHRRKMQQSCEKTEHSFAVKFVLFP